MKCPACKSELNASECELGSLGMHRWFRCRYCGMDFSEVKRSQWMRPPIKNVSSERRPS